MGVARYGGFCRKQELRHSGSRSRVLPARGRKPGHPGQPPRRDLDLSLVSVAITTETRNKSQALMRKSGIPGIRSGMSASLAYQKLGA